VSLILVFFAIAIPLSVRATEPSAFELVDGRVPVIEEDKKCEHDKDCGWTLTGCICGCDSYDAMNSQFTDKYSALRDKLCTGQKWEEANDICERIMYRCSFRAECVRNRCTLIEEKMG
jgi:hypothetical protein